MSLLPTNADPYVVFKIAGRAVGLIAVKDGAMYFMMPATIRRSFGELILASPYINKDEIEDIVVKVGNHVIRGHGYLVTASGDELKVLIDELRYIYESVTRTKVFVELKHGTKVGVSTPTQGRYKKVIPPSRSKGREGILEGLE